MRPDHLSAIINMSIRPNGPLRPYNIYYILPEITKCVKYYAFITVYINNIAYKAERICDWIFEILCCIRMFDTPKR